ncbi:MAG: hypothetical protein ABW217_18765 [Polyangiaceae bacterium]
MRLSGAAALLVASTAAAQTDGEAPQGNEPARVVAQGQCPPAPDESLQGPARSEALLRRFRCLFDAGQYHACLPVLDEACKLTDAPRCLYSKAVVHHALYHCELAVSYYEAYLSRDPYDSVRDEAVSALTELRRICAQPEPAPPAAAPVESAIEPLGGQGSPITAAPAPTLAFTPAASSAPVTRKGPSPVRKVLAFSTLGAGVASAVATAVFASYGQRAESDIVARAEQNGMLRDDEARALDDNGKRYNTLAWVFLGGSVALLGTSVTLFVLDARAEQSLDISTEGSLSVRYRGSF